MQYQQQNYSSMTAHLMFDAYSYPLFLTAADPPFGRHDYQQPVVYPQGGPDGIAYNKPPENKGKF